MKTILKTAAFISLVYCSISMAGCDKTRGVQKEDATNSSGSNNSGNDAVLADSSANVSSTDSVSDPTSDTLYKRR